MTAPNLNTAKGLAKLITSSIELAKAGELPPDSNFNWEELIKQYAQNHAKHVVNAKEESDAVRFCNWVFGNYSLSSINNKYYHNNWSGDLDELKEFTIDELYTLFKTTSHAK